MITIALQGGLGNQMFQYALGVALENRGRSVQYHTHRLAIGGGERPHRRGMPDYGLDGYFTTVKVGQPKEPLFDTEGKIHYDERVWSFASGTMSGFWQSEKYFHGVEHLLSSAFMPKAAATRATLDLCEGILDPDTVAVQVRRGDYLAKASEGFHGVMTRDYFLRGIELTGKKNVYIFTDDTSWCEENLPGTVVNTGSRHWDIQLMSECNSIVVSNSTFGWWGAWLGDQRGHKPGRVVVAPRKWFLTSEIDYSDVVPERWTKL
jgi:hypothetical protein